MLFGKRFTMMLFGYFSNIQFHIKFLQNHKIASCMFCNVICLLSVLKACSVISKTNNVNLILIFMLVVDITTQRNK